MNSGELFKEMLNDQRKKNADSSRLLSPLLECCCIELSSADKINLVSKVSNKQYFYFKTRNGKSRAVNLNLYSDAHWAPTLEKILNNPFSSGLSSAEITECIYTCAMLFCCANDLRKKNDQKTPGTFFEFLIKTVISAHLNCGATTSLPVMNMDGEASLPTDLIFDLGTGKPKFHVPVKTSTRERVIQVWAHQRVIDGAYGVGRFLGFPVILTETKLDAKNTEVVEICLPNQWMLYQLFISQLWGVAYLDIPEKYQNLNAGFPAIRVYTLGDYLVQDGILNRFLKGLLV